MENKFKVWLVEEGEPIPQLDGIGKNMRTGNMCEVFSSDKNVDVTWWTSCYFHYQKKYFKKENGTFDIKENWHIKLVKPKIKYKKNISVRRILYCKSLAKQMKKQMKNADKPDAIICGWPLIELSEICVRYGKKYNIPVFIDIRDLWPDIFSRPFLGLKKKIVSFITNLLYKRKTSFVMKSADIVIGVVPKALELSLKYGREKNDLDFVLPLCAFHKNLKAKENNSINLFLKKYNLSTNDNIITYVGSFASVADIKLIADSINCCTDEFTKFVICGSGENYDKCKKLVTNKECGIFPGYLNYSEIAFLLNMSKLGFIPYINTFDFKDSIPTKFGEYLSYYLPIITSLQGISKDLLAKYNCGFYAKDGYEVNSVIERYFENPSLYDAHKKNAKLFFEKHFNADNEYIIFLSKIKKIAKRENR